MCKSAESHAFRQYVCADLVAHHATRSAQIVGIGPCRARDTNGWRVPGDGQKLLKAGRDMPIAALYATGQGVR